MRTILLPLALLPILPALPEAQSHLFGATKAGEFGASVDVIGDVDGDGVVDIVVGSPMDDTVAQDAGCVSVISLGQGVVLWRAYGKHVGDHLGASVSGAGDVDGDGIPDVVVGMPGDDNGVGENVGMVKLFSGKSGKVLSYSLGYRPMAAFGWSVDGGMDVNLDGFPDMLVGAIWGGHDQEGSVRVISGKGWYPLLELDGDLSADWFGHSVAFLGDVDLDGVPDWAAGAPWGGWTPAAGVGPGYVQVRTGAGKLIQQIPGPQPGSHFGWAVAAAGDADLDGRPDLAVGAPGYSYSGKGHRDGRVQVLSVLDYSILNDVVGPSESEFGTSVAGIGDASGDGAADFVAGAPAYSLKKTSQAFVGAAFAWRGNLAQPLAAWQGTTGGAQLGAAVVGLGNIDKSPLPEVLIGSPGDGTAGYYAGAVFIETVQ